MVRHSDQRITPVTSTAPARHVLHGTASDQHGTTSATASTAASGVHGPSLMPSGPPPSLFGIPTHSCPLSRQYGVRRFNACTLMKPLKPSQNKDRSLCPMSQIPAVETDCGRPSVKSDKAVLGRGGSQFWTAVVVLSTVGRCCIDVGGAVGARAVTGRCSERQRSVAKSERQRGPAAATVVATGYRAEISAATCELTVMWFNRHAVKPPRHYT